MTKILIAGGAGFIGAYLTHQLCRLGANVLVLDALRPYAAPTRRHDLTLRQSLIAGAEFQHIDLLDFENTIHCLKKYRPDAIINLAANPIVASADRDRKACELDIIHSTRNLVRAISETNSVKRLVHVSSSMVYGDFQDYRADECSPVKPVNAYGRMKLAAEILVRKLAISGKVETVIVRPIAVYGPGDSYERVIPTFCARALAGQTVKIHDTSDMLIDFSYVKDIAEGLVLATLDSRAAGEIFNISYGEARSLLDVVKVLKFHFPELKFDISSPTGPLRPSRGALDISKIIRLLGYKPSVDLETGMDLCVTHLKQTPQVRHSNLNRFAQ